MTIRPFTAADGLLMRDVRLRSLADAPYAFGGPATYDEEAALPDDHWHTLAAEVAGEVPKWRDRCISFVALDDAGEPRATASCFRCVVAERRAYFSAAWVDPRDRRRGLGRQLVGLAIDWAATHGADHLRLWVDDANPGGAAFYRTLGFTPTGDRRPVAPGATGMEAAYEMRLVAP